MEIIKSVIAEQQTTVRNIEDILKQAQIEVVQQGEKFLKKYINNNMGISLLNDAQLNEIMNDLQIVERIDDNLSLFTVIFHKVYIKTDEDKYRILYCHPSGIAPCFRNIGLAYVIGYIMFTNEISNKTIDFEFPSHFSSKVNVLQKAFICSIIVPYAQYRSIFIEYLTNKINNGELERLYIQTEWIEYLGSQTRCDFFTSNEISNFYSSLYFDELHLIWNDLIEKALNHNYMHPSNPYQVLRTDDVMIDKSGKRQKIKE